MAIPAPFGVSASGLPPLGDQANAVLSGSFSAVGPGAPFAFRGPMNLLIWAAFATALTTTASSLAITTSASGALAPGASVNSVNVPPGATLGTFGAGSGTLVLPPLTVYGQLLSNGTAILPAGFNVNQLVGASVKVQQDNVGGGLDAVLPAGTTVLSVFQQNVPPTGGQGGGAGAPGTPGIIQLSNSPSVVPLDLANVPLQFNLTANAIVTGGADASATFTGAAIIYTGTIQLERSVDGGMTWLVCNIGGTGTLAEWSAGTPVSLTFGEPEKQVLYRLNCTAYTAVAGTSINYRISQTGGAAESLAIGPLTSG
jgi:hypothetical protein